MKIGMSFNPYGKTYGRYGKEKFLKLKEHGYDAADYEIANTDIDLYNISEEELRVKVGEERACAQAAGIVISQVHGPWCWPLRDTTEEGRAERLEKMKRAAVITALLGSQNLVIHPIMPYGLEDLQCDKGQETWDLNVAFFSELVAFAKEYGVTICLENMPMIDFSIATPAKVLELVKTINQDNCKMCLDTGHTTLFPELSIGDEIRRLGSYLKVMHIHDNMGDRDSHLYPAQGVIDWDGFFEAINEVGYTGILSLETAPDGTLEDDAFEKESINLYKMFSGMVLAHQKANA